MKRNDIIVIGSILLIGFISLFAIKIQSNSNTDNTGKAAVIYINSQKSYEFPINNTNEMKTISFQFAGHTGYLDMQNGAVRLEEMDLKICPQKICSDTGWINRTHQPIVCLPNKIVVDIENNGSTDSDQNAVDNTTY